MLSHPTGTAMLSNVHLTCCLDGTNMVSLSACLDFTMRSTHKQKQLLRIPSVSSITVPPAQWAHHLRTILYWCLWSYLCTLLEKQTLNLAAQVRGKQRDYRQDWSSSTAFTQNTHNQRCDTSLRTMSNFSVIKAKILQIPSFLTEQSKWNFLITF